MEKEKGRETRPEDDTEVKSKENTPEDVIATIHVLKNKTQVKKRVVTRDSKYAEKS